MKDLICREGAGRLRAILCMIAALLAAIAVPGHAGTPPSIGSTSSVNLHTVNALAGVGDQSGYLDDISGANSVDLLNIDRLATDTRFSSDPESTLIQTKIRVVTVKRIADDGTASIAGCLRLGPDTNSPGLACGTTAMSVTRRDGGGCYLANTNDSCTFLLRPITNVACTTSGASPCLPKLWAITSGGSMVLHTSVSW